jgi:hypothetical protein
MIPGLRMNHACMLSIELPLRRELLNSEHGVMVVVEQARSSNPGKGWSYSYEMRARQVHMDASGHEGWSKGDDIIFPDDQPDSTFAARVRFSCPRGHQDAYSPFLRPFHSCTI